MDNVAIQVERLNKFFPVADGKVHVLKDIDLEIHTNNFTVIYGPSGCGKSTLLHTVLGLEKPTSGRVRVLGLDIYKDYSEDQLALFRKKNIGMVYQQANWVKAISVIENVALPLALLGVSKAERIGKAADALRSMDMIDWAKYNPAELSSGQQQKVSLARALITDPKLIIADEPTGNLDYDSGTVLMNLLKSLSQKEGKTVIMVTHDLDYLKLADKAINLFDGRVTKIYFPQEKPEELIELSSKIKKHE